MRLQYPKQAWRRGPARTFSRGGRKDSVAVQNPKACLPALAATLRMACPGTSVGTSKEEASACSSVLLMPRSRRGMTTGECRRENETPAEVRAINRIYYNGIGAARVFAAGTPRRRLRREMAFFRATYAPEKGHIKSERKPSRRIKKPRRARLGNGVRSYSRRSTAGRRPPAAVLRGLWAP